MSIAPRRSLVSCLTICMAYSSVAEKPPRARVWVSSEDLEYRLTEIPPAAVSWSDTDNQNKAAGGPAIRIIESETHQTVLGMGSSLEHTTSYNLSRLPETARRETLRRLVNTDAGIGMNLMRVCIGTPDFTGEAYYSYCDPPDGLPDLGLKHFSIEKDKAYVIPALKSALQENPDLLYFASPWSPPGWMTTTGDLIGGKLMREYFPVYAEYFVRFIRAYAEEGIPIFAVTVQNEPGVDRSVVTDPKWKYPSCSWSGEDERDFIRDHLGPAFAQAGLLTRIWTYDHNFNTNPTPDGDDPGIEYPSVVLRDPNAARFVDGVAFHGYAGNPSGMSKFAGRFPGVNMYFTEGSTFGTRGALKIVSYFANGASSYNAWVTMIDEHNGPNKGPFEASRTCITLDSTVPAVTYHFDYYMYGQFMKFVQRGAIRLGTTSKDGARDAVAFRNPDGTIALVAVNPDGSGQTLQVETTAGYTSFSMPPKSVATVVFAVNP